MSVYAQPRLDSGGGGEFEAILAGQVWPVRAEVPAANVAESLQKSPAQNGPAENWWQALYCRSNLTCAELSRTPYSFSPSVCFFPPFGNRVAVVAARAPPHQQHVRKSADPPLHNDPAASLSPSALADPHRQTVSQTVAGVLDGPRCISKI